MNWLPLAAAATFLLALSAAVAQQPQTPQTGSSTGPATSSSPVATPGNSSGTARTPEDAQDDQSMTPEDGDDDRSSTPEDANDDEDATAAPNNTAPSAGAVRSNNVAGQNAATEGCWARLYDAENFIGRNITLVGPAEMPNMEGTFRSIEVGPNATVVTFSDENFADESGRFGPGNRAANLREPGSADEFASLQLTCAQPTAR